MKQEIIICYNTIKNNTNKIPTRSQIVAAGFSAHQVKKYFNSFSDLKRLMGDKLPKFKTEIRECKTCNNKFDTTLDNRNKQYCSPACGNKVTKYKHGKYLTIKKCQICNNSHKRTSAFCSKKCSSLNYMNETTIGDLLYISNNKANTFGAIRANARSISKYYFKPECKICGYDKHYEVCHINPIRNFPNNTTLSVVNSRNNLMHLCPNCHWEFDHQITL